jgi:signal transduction histidine kinase
MTRLPPPILILLFLALLLPVRLQAATPAEPGQLSGALRCAARDSLGQLWLGTAEGLFSWDGKHLLRQDSRDGWEAGSVSALVVDGQGVLWAAADSGMVRRDEVFRRVELHSPVALGRGQALRVQGDTLWLGTERGLLRWQERQGERVLLSGMSVTCLGRLPDGHLICGTQDRGLFRFDQEGNPAAMRESYRSLLPAVLGLQAVGDGSGDLMLLGRGEDRRLGLAILGAADGQVRRVGGELPQSPGGSDWKLLRDDQGVLLRAGASWLRWTTAGLKPMPAPVTRLSLPVADVLGELPQLAAMRPEGRLEVQSRAAGLLSPRDGGVALAWESPVDGGWRPVQVAEADGASWVLLHNGADGRVLRATAAGSRALDLSLLGGTPTTLCATPGGGLLLGTTGGLHRMVGERPEPLPGGMGAHWLVPFSDSSVLVAGPQGLALWEDGDLQRLRISEPVYRAVPDGFGGVLAACDRHLLRLNELNELDTLSYPERLSGPDGAAAQPGQAVRQLLADAAGRIWLLDEQDLHLRAREGAPWTRPLAGAGVTILSLALDATGRLWLSTREGTGWLVPDRTPPVVVLLQDPRELEQADHRLILRLGAADPLGQGPEPLVRLRLDDQAWGPWRPAGEIPLLDLLPPRGGGTFRLQVQALDAWGNLSRQTLVLPLVVPKDQGRLPFAKRLFLLLALVAVAVLATTFYPGRTGLLASVGLGVLVGAWVFLGTTEPHLWWALPIILGLSSKLTSDQLRSRREKERRAPEPGILDVVDLLRDFGHSGSATRNLDRLLRGARNLYLDGHPDPDVLQVFRSARGVFLDLTVPTLENLLAALRRLGPGERALGEEQLSRLQETVADASRRLGELSDPPPEDELRALAFVLDRLERALVDTQQRVDLCISSPPLKVLDRVLEDRAGDLAGVELELHCEREVRQVMVRLPVDRLQFILDNLVDNALHWMGGRPVQRLSIDVRERPSTLQLRVSDTGPGIPPEEHERIFGAGVSGKDEESGTLDAGSGYGLYRSREILARFGGRLVVERSVVGEGSTFLLEVKKVEPGRS